MFIDEAQIWVKAGDGGNGCVSQRVVPTAAMAEEEATSIFRPSKISIP